VSTGYYLIDHPNPAGPHYYRTRIRPLLAQVIHITAGLQDLDGPPDRSAEDTAHYAAATTREVSWHTGSDSDGWLDLLPYEFTAWQCVGYNSSTAGHEISKADTDWRDMPPEWVDATLRHAADAIRPKLAAHRIPIRKCTRAELDAAIAAGGPPAGLIGHHELDPTRRTDPGLYQGLNTFPWDRFLRLLREGDDMPTAQDLWAYKIKNPIGGVVMTAEARLLDVERTVGELKTALVRLEAKLDALAGPLPG
jgi:hypothetical protein